MEVQLRYIEGCPNVDATLKLLEECLTREGLSLPVLRVKIRDANDAVRNAFLGSPSVLIDGSDIEQGRGSEAPLYGCRLYASETGVSGVPPPEMMIAAIRRARSAQNPGELRDDRPVSL